VNVLAVAAPVEHTTELRAKSSDRPLPQPPGFVWIPEQNRDQEASDARSALFVFSREPRHPQRGEQWIIVDRQARFEPGHCRTARPAAGIVFADPVGRNVAFSLACDLEQEEQTLAE
jgi:hypothetical protein